MTVTSSTSSLQFVQVGDDDTAGVVGPSTPGNGEPDTSGALSEGAPPQADGSAGKEGATAPDAGPEGLGDTRTAQLATLAEQADLRQAALLQIRMT